MLIHTEAAGPFQQNGYIVGCEETGRAVIIDPGDGVDALLAFAAGRMLALEHILLTHAHVDHITGVAAAKRALGAPIHLHRDDLFLYDRVVETARMFGLTAERQPPVDAFYAPRETIAFGTLTASVHHTPGHCPGGVCLAIGKTGEPPKDLFVGDTLFAGSIGRTDLPGGDFHTLLRSITDVLFAFGDDARVYSGHGPMTTIGRERRANPFLAGVDA
jgi:glyoxylase-like metal-dependent hydrolase (beta-lactamase superfamily II)